MPPVNMGGTFGLVQAATVLLNLRIGTPSYKKRLQAFFPASGRVLRGTPFL
ncbi:MAG: hypothetical protein VB111_12305 [Clostridiaceae bacterium]|nr:hypothetical protein [Clostridiaceae bacterium]